MRTLDAWYEHMDAGIARSSWIRQEVRVKRVGKQEAKEAAERRWPRRGPATACGCSPSGPERSDGELRIVADPPLIIADRGPGHAGQRDEQVPRAR